MSSLYSVEFFDLQLRFAARVAEIAGVSLGEAVGTHTNIYVRLGMGPQLDANNPDWVDYVAALSKARTPAAWTYQLHRQRQHLPAGPAHAATVGCFSYAQAGQDRVRLHFQVGAQHPESPLSIANLSLRQRELAALLGMLKASSGQDLCIVGASWLYNLPAYRRIFPQPYLAGLHDMAHPYQRLPLWGQFLNRDLSLRSAAAARFLACVAKASHLNELAACFPLSVLTTSVPAQCIYDHLGL